MTQDTLTLIRPDDSHLHDEIFEHAGALDKLENFASHFGPRFYALEPNQETIILERSEWQMPTHFDFGNKTVVPVWAGDCLTWRLRQVEA